MCSFEFFRWSLKEFFGKLYGIGIKTHSNCLRCRIGFSSSNKKNITNVVHFCRMEYKDLLENFTHLDICHLSPGEAEVEKQRMLGKTKKCWQVVTKYSEWRKKTSAGGRREKPNPYHINPQFHVTLTVPEEGKSLCTLFVGLMQKDNRAERRKIGIPLHDIGFTIFHVSNNMHYI